jgi:hypothetical protein
MKKFLYLCLGLSLATMTSCEKVVSPPAVTSRPEAGAKFQKIMKNEFNYSVVLKDMDHTVWIYVPLQEPVLEYKAKNEGANPTAAPQSQEKIAIRFLKVDFKDNVFKIDYDIAPVKQYTAPDPGYATVLPEVFQRKQQNILSSVGRSYLDLEVVPGDVKYDDPQKQATHEQLVEAYVKTGKAPEFFVIVFADIERGIKIVNTTHFRDLEKALSLNPSIAQEEYTKRYISEILGDPTLIGDKTGEHLQYSDIALPDFLAKQIQYRINLKYGQSSFAPNEDAVKEILRTVAETTQAYEFPNFTVQLHDLNTDKLIAFEPSQLKMFQQ